MTGRAAGPGWRYSSAAENRGPGDAETSPGRGRHPKEVATVSQDIGQPTGSGASAPVPVRERTDDELRGLPFPPTGESVIADDGQDAESEHV